MMLSILPGGETMLSYSYYKNYLELTKYFEELKELVQKKNHMWKHKGVKGSKSSRSYDYWADHENTPFTTTIYWVTMYHSKCQKKNSEQNKVIVAMLRNLKLNLKEIVVKAEKWCENGVLGTNSANKIRNQLQEEGLRQL